MEMSSEETASGNSERASADKRATQRFDGSPDRDQRIDGIFHEGMPSGAGKTDLVVETAHEQHFPGEGRMVSVRGKYAEVKTKASGAGDALRVAMAGAALRRVGASTEKVLLGAALEIENSSGELRRRASAAFQSTHLTCLRKTYQPSRTPAGAPSTPGNPQKRQEKREKGVDVASYKLYYVN